MSATRMLRHDRRKDLLDAAWRLIGEHGAGALTLGEVARLGGVSKPVAYDHFGTRAGLLCALYHRYYNDHLASLERALAGCATVAQTATTIAAAYVACVQESGPVAASLAGAMHGAADLDAMKRDCDERYIALCADTLMRRAGKTPGRTALVAFVGAAASVAQDVLVAGTPPDEGIAFLAGLLVQSVA